MNEYLDKKSIRAMQVDGIKKVKEYYELIDKMPKSEFLVVREDVIPLLQRIRFPVNLKTV